MVSSSEMPSPSAMSGQLREREGPSSVFFPDDMTSTLPPNPLHILRTHVAQINSVFFSEDNERLYGGDLQGWVTVTSTRTLRSLARWQAHSDSVLAVQEWNESTLTSVNHARVGISGYVTRPIAMAETINFTSGPGLCSHRP